MNLIVCLAERSIIYVGLFVCEWMAVWGAARLYVYACASICRNIIRIHSIFSLLFDGTHSTPCWPFYQPMSNVLCVCVCGMLAELYISPEHIEQIHPHMHRSGLHTLHATFNNPSLFVSFCPSVHHFNSPRSKYSFDAQFRCAPGVRKTIETIFLQHCWRMFINSSSK